MLRERITLDEIVEITGGALVDGPDRIGTSGEEIITSVSTDTRSLQPGALFAALVGERHDGHDFIRVATEAGASALLVDRALHDANVPHVVVPDTLHALGDIARYVRDAFTGPVVGVTGSVGKTTVKEMVTLLLEPLLTVHKSAANHNNEIGVPQTILALETGHQAAVIEMGMRGSGEIRRLCEIAAPTIGVITRIGVTHIERLGSQNAIADAKGELLEMLPPDGVAVLPAADPFLPALRARFSGETILCGAEESADVADVNVRASEIVRHQNGWRFILSTPWGRTKVFLPTPGRFNIQNALLSVAVAGRLGVPLDSIARALGRWSAPPMRLEVIAAAGGFTILSDAYNAAPDSMQGALETLADTRLADTRLAETPVGENGRRIAVLGEMRELGDFADSAHAEIGRKAAALGVDILVTVGELAEKIADTAAQNGVAVVHRCADADSAATLVPTLVRAGDVVVVKGSRALLLEQVVERLR